jgi:hypothetical protein
MAETSPTGATAGREKQRSRTGQSLPGYASKAIHKRLCGTDLLLLTDLVQGVGRVDPAR